MREFIFNRSRGPARSGKWNKTVAGSIRDRFTRRSLWNEFKIQFNFNPLRYSFNIRLPSFFFSLSPPPSVGNNLIKVAFWGVGGGWVAVRGGGSRYNSRINKFALITPANLSSKCDCYKYGNSGWRASQFCYEDGGKKRLCVRRIN